MSVGFVSSVSDFFAVIRLVRTVIDTLRESSKASFEYRALRNELLGLETVLIHVQRVQLQPSQHAEKLALQQTASQCQSAIDDFWKKMQTCQPHLLGTGSRIKDGWAKLRWSLCEKGDVELFRAVINGHTRSLEVLLITVLMNSTQIQAHERDKRNRTLASEIQHLSSLMMGRASAVPNEIAESAQQGKFLIDATANIVQTNLRIFQMVLDIHQFTLRLPAQVQRQQPVYMIDAFGKESPFHLEFVRSPEALISILKVNLKSTGCGPGMIDRGDFAIRKVGASRDVDLTADWDTCFLPGDHVTMSMVFMQWQPEPVCPNCRFESASSINNEVTW